VLLRVLPAGPSAHVHSLPLLYGYHQVKRNMFWRPNSIGPPNNPESPPVALQKDYARNHRFAVQDGRGKARRATRRGNGFSRAMALRLSSGGVDPDLRRKWWCFGRCPGKKSLGDARTAGAAWAGMLWRFRLFRLCGGGLDGVERREQGADAGNAASTCWAGQQAVVTAAAEALQQHMHQERRMNSWLSSVITPYRSRRSRQ
jgi:hypothetical protein